ncbi:MAG: translation initiation factor IF-2 [Dorea sp.]|nr:translation initiation factor IF-2 [Dorea sp.]
MSKIKVYELAKELEVSNKEIVDFLKSKNIEVRTHMSAVDEADAEAVRKAFPKGEKAAEKTEAEAPKKKNIVHVFRPQNTQNGGKQGRRPGGNRQNPSQGRPMQVNNGRPAKKPAAAVTAEKPQTEKRPEKPQQKPAEKPQEQVKRPVAQPQEKPETEKRPEKPVEKVQEKQTVSNEKNQAPRRQERSERTFDRRSDSRDTRPARDGRDGRDNRENRENRENRDNREGRDNRGGQRFQRGDRPQNGRQERFGADRDGRDGRDSRDGRDGRDGRDRNQGRKQGERSDRRGSDRRNNSSIPAPAIEGQKPQRSKGKGKDEYKKKDYRHGDDEDGMLKGKKKNEPKQQLQKPQQKAQKVEEEVKSIVIPEVLTIKDLADKMKIVPSVIVKKLFMQGKIVTVNQEIDYETAEEIALEFDVLCEKEEVVDVIEELLKEDEEDEKKMKKRPPVVCVMGHVDHGKTSLLDAIRHTNVIDKEAGGITQHIGAYVVEINGEKITFLDTPGHEAFTAMRMRGASSTDIAILVVAADDGVMPQTVEAINHAKAAGVEIIVAVNKIDKPSANIERVKQELTEYELIPEDWGGSTIFVPVSAKTGEGLEDLMEMIVLTAEVMELKANPNRRARGLVLEAKLDKGRGSVANILVQKGTLRVGDSIAAGSAHGKVRAMMDDKGKRVKEAGPSTPVEILGLNDVPNAGEVFVGCANDKEARSFADTFISQSKVKLLEDTKSKLSLDDLFTQIQEGNLKELGIVVKADVQGSVEAIKQSLLKLSNDEVVVKIIHGGVGAINESDVSLASASNAIIIGFNVRPDVTAKETADREGVDIRLYRVIYNAIEDVEAAMKGMLDPVFEEKVLGHAEVRQTFKASGVGTIAGSYVLDGTFERDCSVRLTRDGIVIFEGPLASLRRFKDDVKEVRAGYECGFVFANFNDVKEGDLVEAFKMVEIPR